MTTTVSIPALRRAGASAEMILAAIEAQDEIAAAAAHEELLRKRELNRQRSRRFRERKRAARERGRAVRRTGTDDNVVAFENSPDISMTEQREQRVAPSPPIPPLSRDDGDDRSQRVISLISEEAKRLSDEVFELAGIDLDPLACPPGWCGAAMRVQSWLSSGWTPDEIRVGVKTAMASEARRQQGPPNTPFYFEKAIAKVVLMRNRPVPKFQQPPEDRYFVRPGKPYRETAGDHKRRVFDSLQDGLRAAFEGQDDPFGRARRARENAAGLSEFQTRKGNYFTDDRGVDIFPPGDRHEGGFRQWGT